MSTSSVSRTSASLLAMQDSDGSSDADDKAFRKLAKELQVSGQESMTPADLSNCLCGLQNMTAEIDAVNVVLKVSCILLSLRYYRL
jgi:hypothetical protein